VLFAALTRVLPVRPATVLAAVVFGLWHIRPTLGGLDANGLVDGPLARTAAVALLCWDGRRQGSCSPGCGCAAAACWPRRCCTWRRTALGTLAAVVAHRLD
jgi:membrane protease YdiL (CAAX protease family)